MRILSVTLLLALLLPMARAQEGDAATAQLPKGTPVAFKVASFERIDAIVQIARKTEEVGLDVFAIGEHHNPPFVSSSPTTLLAHIAAKTERLILSTDCGFGREGLARRIAFYKSVAINLGANIVRRELKLPEVEIPAADPRFTFSG